MLVGSTFLQPIGYFPGQLQPDSFSMPLKIIFTGQITMYCMGSSDDKYSYYNEMLLIILAKINDNVYIFSFEVFALFIIENKLFVLHE